MNKKHIYCCAIGLFILYVNNAIGAPYKWGYSGHPQFDSYSPSRVCESIRNGNDSPWDSAIIIKQYPDAQVENFYWCVTATAFNPVGVYYKIVRMGDNCPVGTYNKNTGECDCPGDEEKNTLGQCGAGADSGPPPPYGCVGNPVNLTNGNKYQLEVDLEGTRPGMKFGRYYNSADGRWRHIYSTHLVSTDRDVIVVEATGLEVVFSSTEGTFSTPGVELLERLPSGWRYVSADHETYKFDMQGRLVEQGWPGEQALHFSREPDGLGGVVVNDSGGRSFEFTEDEAHQPTSLVAKDVQINYEYDVHKQLTTVTRKHQGRTFRRSYSYTDGRDTRLLTDIIDERGITYAHWNYDGDGRAISSSHANGAELTRLDYGVDNTTVTNPLGKKTRYRFIPINGHKRIVAIEGEPSPNCPNSNSTFTYDARGLLKSRRDNKGNLATYDYDARGLEVSRTEAAGTPQARTITTQWHPRLYLPVQVAEPGRVTCYQYDEQGRQTGRTLTER